MTVEVARHEHAGAALVGGTLAPQPVDFAVLVHLETRDNLVSRSRASVRISDRPRGPLQGPVQTARTL